MQTKKNGNSIWVGTLIAALTFLLTGYLYYNVIKGNTDSGDWMYRIIYALVAGFCLSYLYQKTRLVGGSNFLTGMVIGLIVGVIIIAVMQLGYYRSTEQMICCVGLDCWIVAVQTMVVSATLGFTGKTSGGSDD